MLTLETARERLKQRRILGEEIEKRVRAYEDQAVKRFKGEPFAPKIDFKAVRRALNREHKQTVEKAQLTIRQATECHGNLSRLLSGVRRQSKKAANASRAVNAA